MVMFLNLCVILFGGGSWLPNMHHRSHDQPPGGGALTLGGRGGPSLGGSASGGGSASRPASWDVCLPQGVGRPPPELDKWVVRILLESFIIVSS